QARMLATTYSMSQQQALEPIKTPHALHVDGPSIPSQQHMDAPITVPRASLCELTHSHPESLLTWPATSVGLQRTRDPYQPTRSCDARSESGPNPLDELAFTRRPQIFFRTISARMCLSSERSATRRFNFAFSSRSCRSSRISVLPKFAYF